MHIASFELNGRATYGCADPSGALRPAPATFTAQYPDLQRWPRP